MNQNNWTFGVFNQGNAPALNFNGPTTPSFNFGAAKSEEPIDWNILNTVSERMYKFSSQFYKTLVNSENNNVICSPLSVSIVLSMAAFGARGNTEQQLKFGLNMHEDNEINKKGFHALITALNRVTSAELKLAQKIFIKEGFEIKREFKEVLENSFLSEVQSLDFRNSTVASEEINRWCSFKTNSRIKKIVQPSDVEASLIILVNAVYFKGEWTSKFKSQDTKPRSFYMDDNTSIKVDMMYQKKSFNYGVLEALDAAYVELPYKTFNFQDSISIFIILPNIKTGLQKVIQGLDTLNLKLMHTYSSITDMYLYLPKFKIESSFGLTPILFNMGITNVFSYDADFSGISENVPLKIDKVIQKAFIQVDENGTEAVAVTASCMGFGGPPRPPPIPITFNVDHPFAYIIYHSASNTVLFQGHVTSLPQSTIQDVKP